MMLATKLQAAAGNATQPNYIEDVFSTYLYTGNAGTQTVTNGIDLSGKGGMVWTKSRSNAYNHSIMDTVRGFNYSGTQTKRLDPSTTDGQAGSAGNATQASPLSNGFSITTSGGGGINFYNASGATYVSWTFREQPKFFDVVTFTAGTSTDRRISHSLNAIPGFWIMKALEPDGPNWPCYHRSLGLNAEINLNLTNASASGSNRWGSAPTSTTLGINEANMCNAGYQYVLYIFAHDAGGFGVAGTDNVITCGTFTTDGSGNCSVNLGWEPQWILTKRTNSTNNWQLFDNMRGMTANGGANPLAPNTSDAEANLSAYSGVMAINSTGFSGSSNGFYASSTYIYIAIRRGPMKVPTSGTSVFSPEAFTGNATTRTIGSITTDSLLLRERASDSWDWSSRLTGSDNYLQTNNTSAESSATAGTRPSYTKAQTGVVYNGATKNQSGAPYIDYLFKRAPSFFDEVCWTGNDTAGRTITHNLGAVPEMMIVKGRSNAGTSWIVYHKNLPSALYYLVLESTAAQATGSNVWVSTAPTASVFTVGSDSWVNTSGDTFVNYLFATCAGVSKVGSYTGNGTGQTIDCGFTSGARFVLIKATSTTGSWSVWDTARGITTGDDPSLLLNSTAAESTAPGLSPASSGFALTTSFNGNGTTYIFLAIA